MIFLHGAFVNLLKIYKHLPIKNPLNITSGNRSKNRDICEREWENFMIATGIDEKPRQLVTLLTVVESHTLEVFNTFEWSTTMRKLLQM